MTNPSRFLALLLGAALMAGCESSIPEDVRSVLGPREDPKTQVFQAEEKATYEAVKAAATSMGYRVVHGGPAEGELEALSQISTGEEPGSSRQISMKVVLSPAAESGTAVEVSLTEAIEEDQKGIPGMATQTPLRDTPLYAVFFRNVQQALANPAANQH